MRVHCRWYPHASTCEARSGIEGFYLLKSLPEYEDEAENLPWKPFKEGSVEGFGKLVENGFTDVIKITKDQIRSFLPESDLSPAIIDALMSLYRYKDRTYINMYNDMIMKKETYDANEIACLSLLLNVEFMQRINEKDPIPYETIKQYRRIIIPWNNNHIWTAIIIDNYFKQLVLVDPSNNFELTFPQNNPLMTSLRTSLLAIERV